MGGERPHDSRVCWLIENGNKWGKRCRFMTLTSSAKQKWRALHREQWLEYQREWQRRFHQKHPDRVVIYDARTQFRKLAASNPEKAKELLQEIEKEEGPIFREILLNGIPDKMRLLNQKKGDVL